MKNFNSKVLIWYTTHFACDSRDWDSINKYGNPYHPLWGYYKSSDEDILKKQTDAIIDADKDVIVYDVSASYKLEPKNISKDKVLPVFASMLENQDKSKKQLKYCIIIENYIGNLTYDELYTTIKYVHDNLSDLDCYFKEDGKPFVLVFWDERNQETMTKLKNEFKNMVINQVPWSWEGAEGWLYVEEYPQTLRPDWMPVSPGFDSSLEEIYIVNMSTENKNLDSSTRELFKNCLKVHGNRENYQEIIKNPLFQAKGGRQNGLYYRKQLSRAVENNPEHIFISGWNDWQYQNQIEPAEEYGFQYIEITSEILRKARSQK
jgi:hypothetical protein